MGYKVVNQIEDHKTCSQYDADNPHLHAYIVGNGKHYYAHYQMNKRNYQRNFTKSDRLVSGTFAATQRLAQFFAEHEQHCRERRDASADCRQPHNRKILGKSYSRTAGKINIGGIADDEHHAPRIGGDEFAHQIG